MRNYSRSIVSYLDILGFKNIIESETPVDKIFDILKSFKQTLEPHKMIRQLKPHVDVILFSDLALRVINIDRFAECPEKSQIERSLVFMEIIALARIQIELSNVGILIRGGITIDDIYVDKYDKYPIAFGPAFINAYKLEQNFAIYPRIVVDPCIVKGIQDEGKDFGGIYLEDQRDTLNALLKQDFDGIWRVNYLGLMPHTFNRANILLAHKFLLRTGLEKYKGISREACKYSYLALYHNSFINNLSEDELIKYKLSREELLLPLNEQGLLDCSV